MKLNQEFDLKQYLVENTEGYTGKYSEYIEAINHYCKL